MNPFKKIIMPLVLLVLVIVCTIIGYIFIEHWSFFDALYMVVITLFSVGFMEVHTLSTVGRAITIGLIVFGVGTVAYTVGQLVEMMVEGQFAKYRRRREMEKKVSELKDHYIICGFGRVGHQVAYEFDLKNIPYFVVDSKPETSEELEPKGVPFIIGDMSSDEVLQSAGIAKAKGLIACADSDASNVFVTLSARVLNPKLFIIARASNVAAEIKLKKAGANRVTSPYFIAGNRIAAMAIKPIALDFLDTVTRSENVEFMIQEYIVDDHARIIGKTLSDLKIKQKTGAIILAIKHVNGKFNFQPSAASAIEKDDVLVALGTSEQLNLLRKMVGGSE
ncbi:MAG: potassium channel protein [bacterium]